MKTYRIILAATTMLMATGHSYVVSLYNDQNCQDFESSRNVYDNTCAPTEGFQSYIITTQGGNFQQLTAWSRNACAGTITSQGCAAGVDSLKVGQCYGATNGDGGSNALSSYSSAGYCPN